MPNGQGRITYSNGDIYEGNFENGKLKGQGKFISKNGNIVYEGNFENGKPTGQGRININGKEYKVKNGKIEGGIKLYNGI